jgi:hypothetical protein
VAGLLCANPQEQIPRSEAVVQYLLPCQCGQKTPVDSTKAGQTIECECGAQLDIPTLGGLKKLQQVAQESRPATTVKWAARQRVLLVGILICLIGLGIAGYFATGCPVPPPHQQRIEYIPEYVEAMTLMETVQLWGRLERGLPDGSGLEGQAYQKMRQDYLRRTAVALVVAGAGLLVMFISLFIPKQKERPLSRR